MQNQDDLHQIRRANLQWLCDSLFEGNKAALGKALGRAPAQVSQWLGSNAASRAITERSARDIIEPGLGLPRGSLDDPRLSNSEAGVQAKPVSAEGLITLDTSRLPDPELRLAFERLYLALIKGSLSKDKLLSAVRLLLE